MNWETIGPILISGVIGLLTAYLPLRGQISKIKAEIATQNANAEKVQAETMGVYLNLSKDAGTEVITKTRQIAQLEMRLEQLETAMDAANRKIANLESEKINLAVKNEKLTARVTALEDILRANKIPIPNGI